MHERSERKCTVNAQSERATFTRKVSIQNHKILLARGRHQDVLSVNKAPQNGRRNPQMDTVISTLPSRTRTPHPNQRGLLEFCKRQVARSSQMNQVMPSMRSTHPLATYTGIRTAMTDIKRGPQRALLDLSTSEIHLLDQLYRFDGAWTMEEGLKAFGERTLTQLLQVGALGITPTSMGEMLLLLAHGRIMAYGVSGGAISLETQINRAYLRLSLTKLNCHMPQQGDATRHLQQHDASKQFREIVTPYGHALVAAKLTGDGYSSKHMLRVARRLRSSALAENFFVIILTPNQRKGQAYAAQHGAFFKVVCVLPQFKTPALSRPLTKVIPQSPTPPGPHLSGEAWKADPQCLALPRIIQSVLQCPRDERIEQAMLSLECDGVMSAAQLKSFYALTPADLHGLYRRETLLRTTPSQRTSETRVEFITLSKRVSRLDDHRLAHRCGTGRMRHLMDIAPNTERWKAEHRGTLRYEEPDAVIFEQEGQERAIEFDNGTYSMSVVGKKLSAFQDRGFAETVWGVSNPLRKRSMTREIGDQLRREILLAEWWK